ncbi:MAG: RecX family transcriptional regulator [Clostridia bacterium]|nr:RecX family transcriptional regulator [Clostridia bacterium]
MIIEDKLMNYVLYKMRTIAEVRRKAQTLKLQDEYIDDAIEYLIEAGYLDDDNYCKKYVENVIRLKNASRTEIKNDLLRKGVNEDTIDKYVYTDITLDFEEESAKILAKKKFKLGTELLKVKKYLLSKGYAYDSVSKAIDNLVDLNDNNIVE